MGQAKQRAASTPDLSVLIPSRGRPDKLLRCVQSLLVDHQIPDGVEIVIGFDDDDELYQHSANLIQSLALHPSQLQVRLGPRCHTLAQLLNEMADHSTGKWVMGFCDDLTFEDERWHEKILAGAAKLPRGLGIAFPCDPLHPNFPSLPVVSRHSIKALGYYMAPGFPFWFTDTWWNEIGIITGLRVECDVLVHNPDGKGKTHGLKDVAFWRDFFDATRPMRLKDALNLARAAYNDGSPEITRMMAELPQRQQYCVQLMDQIRNPQVIAALEKDGSDSQPGPHYEEVKQMATDLMQRIRAEQPRRMRVALCVPSGRGWEAGMATDLVGLTAYSSAAGIEIAIINMQSSMISLSRNNTVEQALGVNADYLMWVDSDHRFPPDALVRLLNHQKDIVGCTYNKRVPPYETLGKLMGPPPPDGTVLQGLHEALLLPGGFLLVKADVYRKLKWPHYAEGYRWPGGDGLDAFKAMAREYFSSVPDAETLASLDGTKFGDWIKQHNTQGTHGEHLPYWSEDYFFCRKARMNGFQLWCDVSLSYQIKHIGVHEVTCLPPKPKESPYSADGEL